MDPRVNIFMLRFVYTDSLIISTCLESQDTCLSVEFSIECNHTFDWNFGHHSKISNMKIKNQLYLTWNKKYGTLCCF